MEAIKSNLKVIPFPVKRKETVEETTFDIYFPEEIVPENKFPNYDLNVKGRTALDLTGMVFVKENLERKAAIKRAYEYVCSNAKRNKLKLLNKVKLYIDTR